MNFGEGNDSNITCSFCGKREGQVRKLIAGHNVYICDECIELCNEMLTEDLKETNAAVVSVNELPKPKEIKSDKKLDFDINGKKITVNGENLKVVVDDGKVVSYVIDEKELLKAPLEPNYFRALTDNDIDFLNFTPQWAKFHPFYAWQRATHHTKAVKTEVVKNGEVVEIHIAFSTAGLKNSVATYKVYPDGKLYVFHSAIPTKGMLRFGYQMTMESSMEYITWYGRGPKPTYIDRKLGSKIDLYESSVTDFEYRYMRPQESSNRCDVRYFTLTDKEGFGIRVDAYYDNPINLSLIHI